MRTFFFSTKLVIILKLLSERALAMVLAQNRHHRSFLMKNGAPKILLFSVLAISCVHGPEQKQMLKQDSNPSTETDIAIEPSSTTALGRAAQELSTLTRGKIRYSPKFLAENPQSAGSFSRQKNTLYIDKFTLENPNASSLILNHEMLHARVFGELTRRAPAPWYVSFNGANFGSSSLFLDETLAYRHDLAESALLLTNALDADSLPAFHEATLNEIRVQVGHRFATEPAPQPATLSGHSLAVDAVANKILHGSQHSARAAAALAALPMDAKLCNAAKYDEEFGVTVAEIHTISIGETFSSRIFLPTSGGLNDPRNCVLLQKQVADAKKFAQESSNLFKQAKAELEHILALPQGNVKTELKIFAQKTAKTPIPRAEPSIGRTILSHSSKQGKEFLRPKAAPVLSFTPDLFALLASLRATVATENAVGIAASQVGVSQRVILVKRVDREPKTNFVAYINPEITERSAETVLEWEGCLSVPEGAGQVRRSHSIRIRALNERGEKVEETVEGFAARIFQHEIDHLDGTLFIDKKEPGELLSREEVRRLRQKK
jgi:peptide deformylase